MNRVYGLPVPSRLVSGGRACRSTGWPVGFDIVLLSFLSVCSTHKTHRTQHLSTMARNTDTTRRPQFTLHITRPLSSPVLRATHTPAPALPNSESGHSDVPITYFCPSTPSPRQEGIFPKVSNLAPSLLSPPPSLTRMNHLPPPPLGRVGPRSQSHATVTNLTTRRRRRRLETRHRQPAPIRENKHRVMFPALTRRTFL